jgi:inner membrane protein
MENLTHSLIGATLAEIALPRNATKTQRTLFYVSGILAANLPDADLLYTSITPAPLGYLLHHRGHTHTIAGIVILAALFGIVSLIPALRRLIRPTEPRYGTLVIAALASHLIADAWNSYGVHPFWPLTNRWYYGDAIYILEPWLWMLFGVSVAMNTRNDRGRLLVSALLIGVPIAAGFIGLIPMASLIAIAIVAAILVRSLRAKPPALRAWTSLSAALVFVLFSFGLRQGVRRIAVASTRAPERRQVVDVILNPRAANPLCWSALLIEQAHDSLYYRNGTIAVANAAVAFRLCGSTSRAAWNDPRVQSISALQTAMRGDCRVRAWLQFGRAPVMDAEWIVDARFGDTGHGNFTAMQIAADTSNGACPAHLTDWSLPRADVLSARGPNSFTRS